LGNLLPHLPSPHATNQSDLAEKIETAVTTVLDQGYRTQDIASAGDSVIGTSKMGDLVVEALA
jgi:3-isopropylmalate dehydrogenase